MHYAIVTETYPPEVNGVSLTVQSLEQGLRNLSHQVSVVRPRQQGEHTGSTPEKQHELLLPSLPLPRYPGLRFGLPAARRLSNAWRKARPDMIYIATEGPLGLSALRVARRLGIPVATGFHTRFDKYMRDYGVAFLAPVALRWMRRFHNKADTTLVATDELAGQLRGHGFHSVQKLARAVDTGLFDPSRRDRQLRRQWGLDDAAPAVIHVGRIAPEKNLDLAVTAFRALQKSCPGARFILVGDGPSRESLQRANPDFIFCGVQRNEALARHFASSDLFVFPSSSETFGNVTLEAMASGVPTVAFDYGAAREHLSHGIHGIRVGNGDDAGFVEAVVSLGQDHALRNRMRQAARDAATLLQPRQVATDLDAILQHLIQARRQPDAPTPIG